MRLAHSTLSARDVCAHVIDRLVTSLAWSSPSPSAPPTLVIQLLVRAAAEMRSFYSVAQDALRVPSLETLRKALIAMMPRDPAALLPALTSALHHRLPRSLAGRPRTMAIDYHERPYYGDKETPGTVRGKAKASTKTFFSYATLLVVRRGQSYTVGLAPVTRGREQVDLIAELLAQAARAGLQPRRLLLDRGFYAATTIAWLGERGIPFVIPMVRRGKADQGSGTTPFFARGREGWDTYTWTTRPRRGGKKQAAVGVTVEVCMSPRAGKPPLVYACQGMSGLTPPEMTRLYRSRFRIETSYRQLGQGLVATCSRSPAYRLLTAGIALVLRNVWVWLHATVLMGRAGRRPGLMRLRRQMHWLIHELDGILGLRTEVEFLAQWPAST